MNLTNGMWINDDGWFCKLNKASRDKFVNNHKRYFHFFQLMALSVTCVVNVYCDLRLLEW